MKVLWFTNTPSLASNYLGLNSHDGGWISSLEKIVASSNQLNLCVAFHYDTKVKRKFKIGDTLYYSIPESRPSSKIKRLIDRWKRKIEHESIINDYLEIVDEFQPDLIHIFGSEEPFGLICSKVKTPIVLQIQGNLTVLKKKWFSGLSNFDILTNSNIKSLIRAVGIWHDYFLFKSKAKREQMIFEYCQHYIGRTNWDRLITKTLSKSGQYYHCDEVLRDPFYEHTWILPSQKKIQLFSTLKPSTYKGLETILETANILANKKQLDFEWHIAGIVGNEEIIKIIEKIYKIAFKDAHIYFKGSLSPDKLIEELLISDCFVHPSHIENSPNSVCEAMLLGMPVITTNVGGTASLLENNKEGLLIQDGDPYAMAGAILEILENPDFAISLGKNAQERAHKGHDPNKILTDLLSIYYQILLKNSHQ